MTGYPSNNADTQTDEMVYKTQLCLHNYSTLFFTKLPKYTHWLKESIFNKYHLENWLATYRSIKRDLYLRCHTKSKPSWIKDLNIKPETYKWLEGKKGSSLEDTSIGNELQEQ